MKLIGIARLGRDAEVRYTTDGTPVANFSAAFNYGRKDDQGKRPSQWVRFSLWGERAEKLGEWLTKGRELFITASDVHVEAFEGKEGRGFNLVAKVDDLAFTSGTKEQQGQGAPAPAPRAAAPAAGPRAAPKSNTGFDDMDDEIPF